MGSSVRRVRRNSHPLRYDEAYSATTPADLAPIPETYGFIAADRARRRPRRIDHLTRAEFPGSTGELRPCCWSAHPSPVGDYPISPLHRAISDQIQGEFELTPNFSYFDGESFDEDYLDWEQEVDDFFYYACVPPEKQMRCVVRKLKGRARVWWIHMVQARRLEGRGDVKTWHKMKRLLREQFLQFPSQIQFGVNECMHNRERKEGFDFSASQLGGMRINSSVAINIHASKVPQHDSWCHDEIFKKESWKSSINNGVEKSTECTNSSLCFVVSENCQSGVYPLDATVASSEFFVITTSSNPTETPEHVERTTGLSFPYFANSDFGNSEIVGDIVSYQKQTLIHQDSMDASFRTIQSNPSVLDMLEVFNGDEMLCEVVLKVLKSLDQSHNHKVIDLWLLMLMYNNGQFLQKNAYKILKKKIVDGYFCEVLFDQCTVGHRELVKDYFPSFVSLCEYLLSYKEKQMRQFGIHLYASLVGEFKDTYSRQEVLGALVTHSGSGIAVEVSSALETLILLTSRYIEDLTPMSLHTTGILGYMEYFQEDNLHKVNEIFSRLALFARSLADAIRSSIANETLTDMYTKCGEIDDAFSIFHRLPSKDVYSWTALIDGLAVHGPSLECLHLFSQMLHQMTYASSLLACSGMRTLREGQQIHEDLENSGLLLDLHVEGPQMDMYSKYDMIDDASHIVLMILPLLSSSLLNSEVMHRMYGVSKLSELTFPPKPGW